MAKETRAPAINREQAIRLRLDGQHLLRRLPAADLPAVAGACGVQNTPPGAAALALHARVAGLAPDSLPRALGAEQTLVEVWSLRAAPHVVPRADLAIFTAGLLPESEAELRFFIRGAERYLEQFGLSAAEAVERTAAATLAALEGRTLTKDDLGVEVARRVGATLPAEHRALWNAPDALGNRHGESLVRFAFSVVSLLGLIGVAPRDVPPTAYLRLDEWLRQPAPAVPPERARTELARRYLRCYGPSTPRRMAEWAGIAPAQAERAWQGLAGDVVPVTFCGRPAWLLADDLARLSGRPEPEGVRLLPAHDPYLQQRDRPTLLAEPRHRARLWRIVGGPGAVLAEGEIVALWRPNKRGQHLGLTIEALQPLSPAVVEALHAEAATLAPLRGCTKVTVVVAEA